MKKNKISKNISFTDINNYQTNTEEQQKAQNEETKMKKQILLGIKTEVDREGNKIDRSELLVNLIEKSVKEKVLENALTQIKSRLDKGLFTKQQRQQGIEKLRKMSCDVINFELDKLDVFNKERIFMDDNVNTYKTQMTKKKQSNDQLLLGIMKTSLQIATIVKHHKVKTEIMAKIDQKVKQKNIKIKPNKNIKNVMVQLQKLNVFLDKTQKRCDLINEKLNEQLRLANVNSGQQ